MPYTNDNPPEQLKGMPQGLIRQWVTVFNGLVDESGEESARKQAWGAVKKSWEQDEEGNWVRRKSDHGEMIHDVEIMRSGTHTSSTGQEVTFTDEDLARIAEGYDTAYHESPVVVGHPAENGPAYGWGLWPQATGCSGQTCTNPRIGTALPPAWSRRVGKASRSQGSWAPGELFMRLCAQAHRNLDLADARKNGSSRNSVREGCWCISPCERSSAPIERAQG